MKNNTGIRQHLMGIALTLLILFPHSGPLSYALNPLIVLFLILIFYNSKYSTKIQYVFIFVLFISFLININTLIDDKVIFRGLTLFTLFVCFPFVGSNRIPNIYIYITFLFILSSQIVYILNISTFTTFFEVYYPYQGDLVHYTSEYMSKNVDGNNLLSTRLGGLYKDPNICACFLTFLLAIYLLENSNQNFFKIIWLTFLICVSIFLTGSRTGLVIAILIVLYYFYLVYGENKRFIKIIVFTAIPFIIMAMVFLANEYRVFQIGTGIEFSLGYKWTVFVDYMKGQESLTKLMFGLFDPDMGRKYFSIYSEFGFDSEYGNLVAGYGLVGFIAIITFYVHVFRKINKSYRLIFILFLWMVSNAMLMSYRKSFVIMFILSHYYSLSLKEKGKLS